MKTKLIIFLLFISTKIIFGQSSFKKHFGGASPKFINQNPDGSYIAGFDSVDYISILKLSPCGDEIFYKSYRVRSANAILNSIAAYQNGYVVSGTGDDSTGVCLSMAFYIQLDFAGDSITTKWFDCNSEWGSFGGPILATSDSNLIFRYYIDAAGISNYGRIIKTNLTDTIFWTAQGGNDYISPPSSMKFDTLGNLLQVYSNGISGSSNTVKIDSNGQVIATLSIIDTNFVNFYNSHSIAISTDGGILNGGSVDGETYILKADQNLDSLWTKRFPNYTGEPTNILNDADSGYVLLINNSNQGFDLLYLNSVGDSVYSSTYSDANPLDAKCINKCLDGGFIIIAEATDSITLLPTSLILKTNSLGVIENDTMIIEADICQGSNYILPDGSDVTNAGTYLTFTSNSFGCNSMTITNLEVHGIPTAQINASPILCNEDSSIVVVNATGGTPPYIGTGTFNYPQGNYSFIVIDTYNCTDSSNIVLSEPPPLISNAGISSAICPGDSALLGGAPTGLGGSGTLSYQWSPGTNLSSSIAANPIANLQLTETFEVLVTDSNSCTSLSSVTIIVGSNDSPAILQVGDSLYTTTSAVLYQWYLNGQLVWSSNLPYTIATISGDYQLIVSDSIGCEGVSLVVPIIVTGISKNNSLNSILIFPNPTSRFINIQTTQPLIDGIITIYAVTGEEVIETQFVTENLQLDVSNLNSGLFIIEVKSSEFTHYNRLVLQK